MENDKKLNEQLLDLAYKLSSSLDLQFILNKILQERTLKLLSTKRATIYLLDSDKESLNPVATLDPTDEAQVMSQKLSVKSSLSGRALKAKKSMIFNNASQHSDAYHIPGTQDDEDENLLVLPLFAEKEILGTLNLYRRKELYLKEDVEFAEIFALYASAAIQNALEHQRLIREIKERKEAEERLKNSEERYQLIFDKAPDAYFINDLKGKTIYGNNAMEILLGLKKEDIIGKNFIELGILSANQIPRALRLFTKDKPLNPEEFTINRQDGSKVEIEIRAQRINISNKVHILGIARDITDRKHTDQLQSVVYKISNFTHTTKNIDELYETIHNLLAEVLDVTNFYIAIYDKEENLISFPFYKDSKDVFPAAARPLGKGLTEFIIKTGKPILLTKKEIKKYAKKGVIDVVGTLPELWMGAPLITENKVIGVIALNSYHDHDLFSKSDLKIITFISEQIAKTIEYKRAEEDLTRQKQKLTDILEGTNAGTWDWNIQTGELTLNERWADIIGYTLKELEPIDVKTWINNIHSDDLPIANALLEKHFNRKSDYYDVVFRQPHKDDRWVWVNARGKVIEWTKDGEPLRMSGTHLDITERKQAENALHDANSLKETLLDIIAHDLKNPLGLIKGFAEYGLENEPNNEILNEISLGADNLLNVISNTTTLSKVTIGDTIEKEELNLVEIINRIIKESSPELQFAEMTLDMKLKGNLIVKANPIISEVFRNYISNAIKYAKNGKKILVDATIEDGLVVVNVKDFGKTIAKKDRKNIFIRNVQLGITHGRGLGLAIVNRIAIAHGAEVGVIPNKPKGNNFFIKIPI